MTTIEERVDAVRARIATAARAAARDASEVRVVAATKTRTVAEIVELVAAGIGELGENRVQEWLAKRDALAALLVPVRWHLLGALQRNKVSKVVGALELIQGVADPEIAEAIGRRATALGLVQGVLLEVNTSGEPAKAGVSLEHAADAARRIAHLPGVRLEGYFTVASIREPAACFARLRDLRDRLRARLPDAIELSMGMSDDLEVAIVHGATIVRPGTALFGPRPAMP